MAVRASSNLPHHLYVLLSHSLHHYAVRMRQDLIKVIEGRLVQRHLALVLIQPFLYLIYIGANG